MIEWYQHWTSPCFRTAVESSRMTSRLQGVERMQKSVSFESNRQNPSWCLVVMVTYFIPASFAIPAHLSGSKSVGSKRPTSLSYSPIGMCALFLIHSA